MPAHDIVYDKLAVKIRDAVAIGTPRAWQHVNDLLEYWWYIRHHATEWDGMLWGFDPERWCEEERAEMAQLAKNHG